MNTGKDKEKITERELRRNGSGYYDPTAYKAIKRADAELEGKKSKRKEKPVRQYYVGPHTDSPTRPLKSYIKWKLRVLDELGIVLTEQEEKYLRSLKSEIDIDAYAHELIMRED